LKAAQQLTLASRHSVSQKSVELITPVLDETAQITALGLGVY